MNLYAYVGGDPVNRVDPEGTDCLGVNNGRDGTGGSGSQDCPNGWLVLAISSASFSLGGTITSTPPNIDLSALDAFNQVPQRVQVAQRYGGNSFCGGPTVGAANRFNPFGRINSGKVGGFETALSDVGRLSSANGIKPLGDVMVNSFTTSASILAAIPTGLGNGWYVSQNPISGYTSFSNSGLTLRYNSSGDIHIDIPSGFDLPSGGRLSQNETCHYRR
jgi:hypothetical protein